MGCQQGSHCVRYRLVKGLRVGGGGRFIRVLHKFSVSYKSLSKFVGDIAHSKLTQFEAL